MVDGRVNMSHFAKLNSNNQVEQVIVVHNNELLDENGNEVEQKGIDFCQSLFGEDTVWKQTSYNGNLRKNFAGKGFKYDEDRDAFIAPQPFSQWVLNEDTCRWEAPVAYPDDGLEYVWNDNKGEWEPKETE